MSPTTRPPVRWWPAAVILVLFAAALAWIWIPDSPDLQTPVVRTFPVLFFGALALFGWLVLFSRLPGRSRRNVFLGGALAVGLGLLLFEIQGVDGNLVPIVGFRWGGGPDLQGTPPTPRNMDEVLAAATAPRPGDFPQFYGPERDATLPGPRLARDWQAEPPRELWRREVGEGWSSFAVAGEAAVTQEQRGDDETVVRYELTTGRPVWVHRDPAAFVTTIGGVGPRATPTVAGGRVYTLGATGILNCLELADGGRVWSRNVVEDHGVELADWGLSSSPLLAGELVIVGLGRKGIPLAAYHRATGEPAWSVAGEAGSYSSPRLAAVAGREQVLMVNQLSVAGHDPATGETLWREPWTIPGERISPPLVLDDDRILVSAGYGAGSRLLRLTAGSDITVEELWESRRLKSKFAPMVFRDGTVYGLDDGVLVALDPATGERRWKRGRYGHGQLLLVGDLLLILAENGELALVEANPEAHRELGRIAALEGKTWNPPALAGRRLLVRNNRQAACYELPVEG